MKNLGKQIFLIFILCTTSIYASVKAQVNPGVVYMGESASYLLTITGGEVNKPILDNICGNPITATSSQTSIEMINSSYKKSYVLRYDFTPRKSCTIEPVSVEVDGKIEKSNKVDLLVKPATQNKDADFTLSLTTSKSNVFVGEPFVLHLTLKQSKRAAAVDSKFIEPDFKGFWVKAKSKATRENTPEYIITHASYTLAAQREGNLTIQPAQLRIAKRATNQDMWGSFMPQVKWQSYFSNPVTIHAAPLPDNAKIVGNFTISAVPDKQEITSNEAVNVTVSVRGDGNLEDIGTFKPYIDGVNVFDEKIHIQGNVLTQKLAFVSDKDFTIPSFKLSFYNLKTKKVEQISTKPINIKVKGSSKANEKVHMQIAQNKPLQIQRADAILENKNSSSVNYLWLLLAFVIGAGVGVGIMLFKPLKLKAKESKLNLKDEKLLLIKLLPYKDSDVDVKQIVDILESNIYSQTKEKIDKKLLKEIIKRYNL